MKSKNKSLFAVLERLGIDLTSLPEKFLDNIWKTQIHNNLHHCYEIGFLINEDINELKELTELVNPVKVTTSKLDIFEQRCKTGDEHYPVTHFNPYWEDCIFVCLYRIPYKSYEDELAKYKEEVLKEREKAKMPKAAEKAKQAGKVVLRVVQK